MWQGILNGVLGLWLMLSGVIASNLHTKLNYILPGIAIVLLGLCMAKAWQKVATAGIGFWLIFSATVNASMMSPDNLLIVGAIAAMLGMGMEFNSRPRKQVYF